MTDRFDMPRQLLSNSTPNEHHNHLPYRNMTEEQSARQEQYRARVLLFGKNLISDRIIGRWSDGITGTVLCDSLYQSPAETWFPVPFGEEEMPDNEDLSMNQVPE